MTAETIHDALTLLPSDLTAQADKFRSRKSAVHWRRWTAVAACLILLCSSTLMLRSAFGKSTETENMTQADCGAAPGAMTGGGADNAPVDPEFGYDPEAEQPPFLTLGHGVLSPWSHTWQTELPEGDTSSLALDVPHPLDAPDSLPVLDITGSMALTWDPSPDTVTFRCWYHEAGTWQEAQVTGGNTIIPGADGLRHLPLHDGDCIYEITAQWEDGTATYAFRAVKP